MTAADIPGKNDVSPGSADEPVLVQDTILFHHQPVFAVAAISREAARRAVDAVLDDDENLTEPRLARDLASTLPQGALLWCGSSQPVRDIDCSLLPRADLRVLASRGASGIDGTTSSAIGAALTPHRPLPWRS